MGQAGVYACPIVLHLGLVVKLQRKLNVSRILRTGDLSHRASKAHIRSIEVHMVERVYEIGAELHFEAFIDLEVLLQADVPVVVPRTTQPAQLSWAAAKRSDPGNRKVAVIGKPLDAASRNGLPAATVQFGNAIRTRAAR